MAVLVNLFKLRKHSAPTPPKRNKDRSICLWPSGGSQDREAGGKVEAPPFLPSSCAGSITAESTRRRKGKETALWLLGKKGGVPSRLFSPAHKVQLSPYRQITEDLPFSGVRPTSNFKR